MVGVPFRETVWPTSPQDRSVELIKDLKGLFPRIKIVIITHVAEDTVAEEFEGADLVLDSYTTTPSQLAQRITEL